MNVFGKIDRLVLNKHLSLEQGLVLEGTIEEFAQEFVKISKELGISIYLDDYTLSIRHVMAEDVNKIFYLLKVLDSVYMELLFKEGYSEDEIDPFLNLLNEYQIALLDHINEPITVLN